MLDEMSDLPEMRKPEVFPDLYYDESVAITARLHRMITNSPSRRQMLEENMARIDMVILTGDRVEFNRLCRERRYIQCEWG